MAGLASKIKQLKLITEVKNQLIILGNFRAMSGRLTLSTDSSPLKKRFTGGSEYRTSQDSNGSVRSLNTFVFK